jgi:hypothetical protein
VLTADGGWSAEDAAAQVEALLAEGPVSGVFWLPALDDEGPLEQLSAAAWRAAIDRRVKLLAAVMRGLPAATFLLAATRLGGRFGCDAAGAQAVLGGAVAGFAKALAREREGTLIKVVDLEPSRKTAALADLLIDEVLRDPGTAEVGHADGERWTIGLAAEPAVPDPAHALTPQTRFLITGAAGSIVAAITADLARAAGGGSFQLLDLVPAPDPADPDLAAFAADRDGLKGTIADRLRAAGERPTPKMVERELARIERARAALDALEAIAAAGGTAHWHQCDLREEDQVGAAVRAALAEGPVDVLVHAAGLEISHQLPDKPQAEYDLVFDVKADGWFHLLRALGSEGRPGAAVVFSSIAGRFGNGGQTDYAAANELLSKSASRLRAEGTRAIAIDWTAWAGIGMASRGSIPKMMELAGIDMLPAEHGTPVVRRELTAAGPGAEVLVAGALGILAAERAPAGGADPAVLGAALAGPMADGTAALAPDGSLVVTTTLDPSGQGFLDDHRIDGTAVLPGVMSIEGFAEVAQALCPGRHVLAIEDVELLAPFKFYRDEPRALELAARVGDGGDGTLVADCRLTGRRALPGQGEQETLHATARVRLGAAPPGAPTAAVPLEPGGAPALGRETVYGVYFHGPTYQVLDAAWREDGRVVGRLASGLPPNHAPAARATVTAPRLVELCFQAAGMWELGTAGRMALPTHVDRVLPYAAAEPTGPTYAVVTPRADGATDAEVVGPDGEVLVRLEGYRTIALPGGPPEAALAAIREALA